MDIDRHPHRSTSSGGTTSTTSELFICFTSRLSSSSMKCILSPGRAREPSQISLSASLSRRLKTNGSIKGGQSPMFPKKRGAGFDNVEPSSPKVTCIGQVRVKTKKQGNKMRTRSKRRAGGGGGDVSFRRVDQNKNPNQDYTSSTNNHVNPECLPHRNQRWVHLPVTICEALRTFGAELNCFIPCRSNCMKEKEEAKAEGSGGSSCGAVFARWLVAVQEGEAEGREIELVVGDEGRVENNSSTTEMMMMRSQRRHVFEEIEFKEEMFETKNVKSEEEEEGRVSICIPPKNALLLMRCRSDPVKMAALANKFWEAPEVEEENEAHVEQEQDGEKEKLNLGLEREFKESRESEECEKLGSCVSVEDEEMPEVADTALVLDGVEGDVQEENPEGNKEVSEAENFEKQDEEAATEQQIQTEPVEESQETETSADLEELQHEENVPVLVQESEEDNLVETEPEIHGADNNVVDHSDEIVEIIVATIPSSGEEQVAEELQDHESKPEPNQSPAAEEETEDTEKTCQEEQQLVTHQRSEPEYSETQEDEVGFESKEETAKTESTASVLPDCLLLMMCEPKLSMEVSKETWVCSTDFIRCLPVHSRQVNKTGGGAKPKSKSKVCKTDGGDELKKSISIVSNPVPVQQLPQPSRSSCSYPSGAAAYGADATSSSMANMIEQKLEGGKVYEPFALSRCKSEPRRSAAKLAAPEACFWKNRKLEPHRPSATLGVGAAGVGF
ncbi:histone-lysine N-methyltransferase SETD1B [Tripterygium wilfordii]|uniref:Histone-lysine N-methyltransferase SETD1B n=1 Tax=Tripterygium wilfordii TaxID=458696 RepID=A0A7J7C9X8_TRIWF|nr:uncharacterized protein LOC119986159 [Tripterygium wilfordii]KAF5730735.1 histone-lysine N-methyltransferase SETD1B [Tripterygium wilfordii]